jgi:superfamily II DNA or RNA helicase
MELRQHQKEAMESISNNTNTKGKIILPTGTGKTLIEAEAIREAIRESQSKGELPVIKINSPRILLCFQLFEDIFKRLNSMGISAAYINYNSGKADANFFTTEIRKNGGIYQQIISTTSTVEVQDAYRKALKANLPLIIFSTYHSSEKFAGSGIIPHLTIHDEAHNLVSNEFCEITMLTSGKDLFFTATEKTTESPIGEGMNNVTRFGDIIFTKSPKQMIDAGEMVSPYIHVVSAKNRLQLNLNNLDTDYDGIFKSIEAAFVAHQNKIRESSFDPSKLGAKVLVVCRGQNDLQEIFKSKILEKFRKDNPKIHVFALSSDFGIYNDDEGKFEPPVTNRKKFALLKKVQRLTSADQAIIFHVDMIGEGIDAPGITGVMPFRNCEMTKFIQNIGRASRLHLEDREKLYSGEISTVDRSKWIKPYSWIIIPTFLESSDGFEDRFRRYVNELRDNYGFVPRQQIVIDNVRGLDEDEDIDTVNDKVKNRPNTFSGNIVFDHEFEKLSIVEQIIFDNGVKESFDKARSELDSLL